MDQSYFEVLPEAECWELLATNEVGRVGWSDTDEATVLPVNYVVRDRSVVFRTRVGGKLSEVDGRPVAFEVDQPDREARIAWSVLVRGVAERVSDESERSALLSDGPRPWAPGERPVLVRIAVDSISGRVLSGSMEDAGPAEGPGPQDYQP